MSAFYWDNIGWILLAGFSAAVVLWTFLQASEAVLSAAASTLLVSREGGIFLDIRPENDFSHGHIARARHIPVDEIESRLNTISKFQQKPVIVVCQNGTRSRSVVQQLKKSGFAQVRLLSGGIAAWREAQLPLVTKK